MIHSILVSDHIRIAPDLERRTISTRRVGVGQISVIQNP